MADLILTALASALLKDYAKRLIPNLPDEATLAGNLTKLVSAGVLDVFATDLTNVSDDVIQKVNDKIAAFQKSLGIDEKFLGAKTMNGLFNRCLADLSRRTPSSFPKTADFSRLHDFRYFVSPDWPKVEGVEVKTLFQNAWNLWQKVAFIRCELVDDPKNANLIITKVPIDGRGNILADATVGEGKGHFFPMTMRVDQEDQWTAKKFQGVIAHELGHVLGLGHSNQPRQLMSPLYQDDISEPQEEDKQRVSNKWGPAPSPITVQPIKNETSIDEGINSPFE